MIEYDEKPDLINSVKITGTTDGKLSIGFLNAITAKAYAYIRNGTSTRKEVISPLTNYNILSLWQLFIIIYIHSKIQSETITRLRFFLTI